MWVLVFNGVTPNGMRFTNVVGPYDDKRKANNHAQRIRYRLKRGYLTNHNNIIVQVRPLDSPDTLMGDVLP